MDIRNYWQQGAEEAELEARFAKVRAVKCNCELLDAHQCYAEKHDTTEIDDSKFCRCRCHQIAEQENLLD